MRKIVLFFVVFLPFLSLAQTTLEFKTDMGVFNSAWDAQTLLNSMGYIDNNQKQNLLAELDSVNGFLLDVSNVIKFSSNRFSVAFGNHIFGYGLFDKDLVRLALYGNTNSLGESFNLLPLEAQLIHYSDIEFGYQFDDKFWAGISLIAGHQMLYADFSKLNYNSGQNGEYLSYDLIFEGKESGDWQNYVDSISEINDLDNLYNTLGHGVSMSFEFRESIYNGELALLIQDLGFIRWSENTTHFDISSSEVLLPLEVSDFNNVDTDYYLDKLDSLENLIDTYAKAYTMALPTRFSATFTKPTNNKYFDGITASAFHIFNVFSTPRFSLDFHKNIKKNEFVLGYHFGGLEKNGFQFNYFHKRKNVHYNLFTRELSLLSPSQTLAVHVGLVLKFIF